MKFFVPVALALFGTALAAPVGTDSVDQQANRNPDILYFMPVGWGKRSEENAAGEVKRANGNPDILYFNSAGWGKRSEENAVFEAKRADGNPDILYFMPVGWGKRSEENAGEAKRSEDEDY
ncbi:hypothetical protein NQ176_g11097 [Zarea fungicola]|uniref:Uncharacterized protein n=1 Tax=Zarea fungicola TaxID=93591 RepID=A0ACC1MC09_9HYPO|nr:hypothetical protein NQ176_g11097 [Lecanicillium fungicola]